MKKVSLAKKYIKALTESLKDKNEYDEVKSELDQFLKFMMSDEKIMAGLETMLLSYRQKHKILNIYNDKAGLNKKTYNFLKVVIENNRMSFLDTMTEMMEDLWHESRGTEKFVLFSAIELEPDQEKNLKERLGEALKKEVVFDKRVDPSLLAGIKLKKGSIYYDFSIEGNLKKLRESLISDNSI